MDKKEVKDNAKKEIKNIVLLSQNIPSGLKLSIIVTVSLFWVQVIRSILADLFSLLHFSLSNMLVDFLMALIVTFLAYLVLLSYPKVQSWLKRNQDN